MDTLIIPCEQIEERLALLHRASLELVQDVSSGNVLERIATIAVEQVSAKKAVLGIIDHNSRQEHIISAGFSDGVIKPIKNPPEKIKFLGEIINTNETVLITDFNSDERFSKVTERLPKFNTLLCVPIQQRNHILGHIYLLDKINGKEYTSEDQQVIEILAAYASISISNARLYQQLTERDRILTQRNQNLALLNHLAANLAAATDIDQILEHAINPIIEYLHIESGDIFLRQEKSNLFSLVLHRSATIKTLWSRMNFLIGEGMVGMAALTSEPQILRIPETGGYDIHPQAIKSNLRHLACFPLIGQKEVLGVISVATDHENPLDELEIQFLSVISSWLGTSIENMRLNMQQRRLAVLEERERIGMDLHDGIIQSIYAVGLTLEHARLLMNEDPDASTKRIEQAVSNLNSTIRDIRAYILDLRPRQLHDENLIQGVQRLISEFRANTQIEIILKGSMDGFSDLPAAQAIALFHICQEALANIAKHAKAHHVEVSLWAASERVLLEVSDDGCGLDIKTVKVTLGHGLSNMQTRARNAGGDVEISSEPGKGVSILAWVPFYNEEV